MLPNGGLSVRPLTDVEIRNQQKLKRAEEARKKQAQRREQRRLTKSRARSGYERYQKEREPGK